MSEPSQNQNLKAFNDVINLLMWFDEQPELLPHLFDRRICTKAAQMLDGRRNDYARKLAEEADDE